MVATKAVKEDLWLEGLVCDLGASPKDMMMFWDSQSTFIYFYQCKEVYNNSHTFAQPSELDLLTSTIHLTKPDVLLEEK